jgi:hypothetical protein
VNADPALDRVASTLQRYDEPLLRKVAARLARPRGNWPVDDLVRKCVEVIENPPVLDRRLADLPEAGQRLLALIGRSRQLEWPLGAVIELLVAFGEEDVKAAGLVQELLEAGVLFPALGPAAARIGTFGYWMSQASVGGGLSVFTVAGIASRAVFPATDLPDLAEEMTGPVLEADGLDWQIRLGVLWQQVSASPLRRTQGGGLFKRDVERLEQDPLLNTRPAVGVLDLSDVGFLTAEIGERAGILTEVEGEIRAAPFPSWLEGELCEAIEGLFPCLFQVRAWSPLDGYRGEPLLGSPFPSAYLLSLTLLLHQRPEGWVRPAMIEDWVREHHPYWRTDSMRPSRRGPWAVAFLLGICLPLRLVQAVADGEGGYAVRLTPVGRWLLGKGDRPPPPAGFPRTLLVQPNLEVLAYRQGLTPSLVARLTRAATWKTIGAACTLVVEPETVYRALEAGESLETLTRMLDQHGTRPTPAGVLDLLRTWANKRERITVYPAATLLEFNSPSELEEALARGVSGVRATDTVLVVPSEDNLEFRHFRLAGSRDYSLSPERCVSADADGVTLNVDLAKSDLLLETEMPRFADLVDRAGAHGRRVYRLTPESMGRAREAGWTLPALESWFAQRVGQPATPAAKLLLAAAMVDPPTLRTHLVLHVASAEIADGLQQWPQTRELIAGRLGPTTLAVNEENVPALRAVLLGLGVEL